MLERMNERIEYIHTDGTSEESLFDLSTTGVSCLFRKHLVENTFVSVKINDLVLKARVAYCRERKDGFRLGLQFVDVSGEKQKKINDSVEKFSRGVTLTCAIVDAPDGHGKGQTDA